MSVANNDVIPVCAASIVAVTVVPVALVVIPVPPAIVRSTFALVSAALPESPERVTPVISPVAVPVPKACQADPL